MALVLGLVRLRMCSRISRGNADLNGVRTGRGNDLICGVRSVVTFGRANGSSNSYGKRTETGRSK